MPQQIDVAPEHFSVRAAHAARKAIRIHTPHWPISQRRSYALLIALLAASFAWSQSTPSQADIPQHMTPLLLSVLDAPVPFAGSDAHTHLVYELWITNFSSSDTTIEELEVLGDGAVLQHLDPPAIARQLHPPPDAGSAVLSSGRQSLLFLHLVLPPGAAVPRELTHRLKARVNAAPPGRQEISEIGGATTVDRQTVTRIGPPLQGSNYISADSCCDAVRHTRAALPVNGRVYVSQRYAVDWEELDDKQQIYVGPREKLESYTIFGKPVLAVADAVVVQALTGRPEQTPGKYPSGISLDDADGNAIILDLGRHRYAMYAHLQSQSIRVHPGDRVKKGQVMALVGNSGNSVAPHLHFQLMNSPLSFASNGLPYEIENFSITASSPGTKLFDEAEANGTPLAIESIASPTPVKNALPLDQLIISFEPHSH